MFPKSIQATGTGKRGDQWSDVDRRYNTVNRQGIAEEVNAPPLQLPAYSAELVASKTLSFNNVLMDR